MRKSMVFLLEQSEILMDEILAPIRRLEQFANRERKGNRANKSVESYKMGRADASHFEPHAERCMHK